MKRKSHRMWWFWTWAFLVVAVDQACKACARLGLAPGESIDVVPGWLAWTHVQNHGAAWGVLAGQRWLLVGVASVVVIAVASAARDLGARSPHANAGLACVLGGAIGNLIDRAAQGFVTDFVDLETPWRWLRDFPVWNVADAALTIGVSLLAWDFLSPSRKPESPTQHLLQPVQPEPSSTTLAPLPLAVEREGE
jgi:signal peptidase II